MSDMTGSAQRRASHEAAIRRYYEVVDAGDVPALLDLFADDAVYARPGYEPFEGRAALEAFYTGERVIESGTHTIEWLAVEGDRAAVNGRFEGRLKDGREVALRWADFYSLDAGSRFTRRDTFFFAPSV